MVLFLMRDAGDENGQQSGASFPPPSESGHHHPQAEQTVEGGRDSSWGSSHESRTDLTVDGMDFG